MGYLAVDFDTKRCWRFRPSRRWLRRNPAYAPASIGFVLGQDITPRQLASFRRRGLAREADYATECQTPKRW